MKPAAQAPEAQVFVCTHARAPEDPLRSGCGEHGPGVFARIKREVLARGLGAGVWVTATRCQGQCPVRGCAVAIYPVSEHYTEVTLEDLPEVLSRALWDTTMR